MPRRPPRSPLFPYTTLFRSVPERYGIYQSVGDSVGPGGISRTLRNVPVMVALAREMERRCPDAWLMPPGPTESDRKSTRLNSSHPSISYAVFCLKKKTRTTL